MTIQDPQWRDLALEEKAAAADIAQAMAMDYNYKVYWLLNTFNLWNEENTFTFPDGDTFCKEDAYGK